ncbi:PASTA domain-containing protein [Nesterenkonia sp. AN1]|uniref:PASTA domain-containing protein n=1 Tax=Nesterenkonia sp. AN1 TaxID=652017 RepID=UPI001268E156|nr:PASTA domain-containing protein [Nesterenkonia sp. AN1]
MTLKNFSFVGIFALSITLVGCGGTEDEPLTVPDVFGLPGDEARDLIEAAGLEPSLEAAESSVWQPSNWEVESTDPEAGIEVEEEDEVIVNLIRPVADEDADASAQEAEEEADLQSAEDAEQEAAEETERAEAEAEEARQSREQAEQAEAAEEQEREDRVPEQQESDGGDLGERVTEAALRGFNVDSFTGLLSQDGYDLSLPPYYAISDIETMSDSTVRVHVQEAMFDEEREQMGRWFFNMTCREVPELDTVVVNDVSGQDSNHSAQEFMRMPGCD